MREQGADIVIFVRSIVFPLLFMRSPLSDAATNGNTEGVLFAFSAGCPRSIIMCCDSLAYHANPPPLSETSLV